MRYISNPALIRGIEALLLHDVSERQVDPLADVLLGLRNIVFPGLLHRSRHDDERAVADRKRLCFPRDNVPNSKLPGRSQGQGTDHVSHIWFVVGVPSHAV
jgi:hypothetical protein